MGLGFMAMLKLAFVANAEAFDGQKAKGTDEHEEAAHGQGLAVIKRAGLAEEAEDGGGEGGRLGASDEDCGAKFAHADGEGEDGADEQGAADKGPIH